jgi:hypothetical protein
LLAFRQNENVVWKKMRRAAEPEEKIPPARLVEWSKAGLSVLGPPGGSTRHEGYAAQGLASVDVVEEVQRLRIEGERVFAARS